MLSSSRSVLPRRPLLPHAATFPRLSPRGAGVTTGGGIHVEQVLGNTPRNVCLERKILRSPLDAQELRSRRGGGEGSLVFVCFFSDSPSIPSPARLFSPISFFSAAKLFLFLFFFLTLAAFLGGFLLLSQFFFFFCCFLSSVFSLLKIIYYDDKGLLLYARVCTQLFPLCLFLVL